jgi:cytochrome c oxidase subunit 2
MIKVYNDVAEKYQILMQDPASPIMAGIVEFHDNILYYLIIILTVVTYFILARVLTNRGAIGLKYLNHSTVLEIIWTTIPAIILVFIAIPSFKLLYSLDEIVKPAVTLKAKGCQWFWSYQISDIEGLDVNFDSYTKSDDDLLPGELRLLDVDNRVLLPIHTPIRLLITAEDVIHSFAVPSFGVKIDAIPGRLNHFPLYILRPGVFYGQCSELCGTAHYNMSIVIEGVSQTEYINWLLSF